MKASTGVGLAVVTAHAVGFVALATRCHGTQLSVEVSAADVSPVLAIDGVTPPELADRAFRALDLPSWIYTPQLAKFLSGSD